VKVDLLADLRSSINVVLLNGNPLFQRVIYETLLKFCKHCRVLGHSTGTCSKGQVDTRPVEKTGSANIATMNNAKDNVFTRVSPPVDAPTIPIVPSVAQDEQQCNQATTTSSEGWETVRKRTNSNGNKQHSPSLKTFLLKVVSLHNSLSLLRGKHLQSQLTQTAARLSKDLHRVCSPGAQFKGIPINHPTVVGYPSPFPINVSLLLEYERA